MFNFYITLIDFGFHRNDCTSPSVKLIFLGSKGHGRSTLLRFLRLNKFGPTTSGASSFFMRSLFNNEWSEEPHITTVTGMYVILCCAVCYACVMILSRVRHY